MAVLLASMAMVVLVFAPFRLARRGCCSPKSLALTNGGLMAGFVVCQILALSLVIGMREGFHNSIQSPPNYYYYSDSSMFRVSYYTPGERKKTKVKGGSETR